MTGNEPHSEAFGGFTPPVAATSSGPPGAGGPPAPTATTGATPAPGWKLWMAFVVPLFGLGGASILGAIIYGIAIGFGNATLDAKNIPPNVEIASLVAQDLCFAAAAIGVAAMFSRPQPWHFGWRPVQKLWSAVGWSALVYGSFVVFTLVWLAALGQTNQRDHIAKDLGADTSTTAAIVVAFLVAVAAPLVEELVFRGALFGSLRSRLKLWPAALITGLAFGSAHAIGSPLPFLLPLAALGTMLCLLYHRTRSLYPSMAVHSLNNSVAIVGTLGWASWLIPVVAAAALTIIGVLAIIVRNLSGPVPADAPCP